MYAGNGSSKVSKLNYKVSVSKVKTYQFYIVNIIIYAVVKRQGLPHMAKEASKDQIAHIILSFNVGTKTGKN